MSESQSPTPHHDPDKGLPPVVPPSGRHIVQLFLIPGIIVAGAVTILLGFSWLAGGSRTPEQFLKNIDSSNADVRWRAANDLAQVLKRDDELAADVGFGLQIAERFARALDELERAERFFLDAAGDARSQAEARKSLIAQRNYVQYLAACLGNFSVPVGAPLLCEAATKGRGSDEKLRYTVRRGAVWALANLGDGQKRFHRLSDARKAEVRRELEAAASLSHATAEWARVALAGLNGESMGVIAALAECAKDPRDIFLREQTAHALIFWEGTPEERRLADDTLLLLARDLGAGHDNRIELKDGE
ncbi:MAG: hypothetical protein N2039_15890 [Gemmataceae bacterium]|nr:hypothetical protein [Gemmataceae bacterium]